MPKTLMKPGYNPKNKNTSQTEKLEVVSSSTLPNLRNFRQTFVSGSGFFEYK